MASIPINKEFKLTSKERREASKRFDSAFSQQSNWGFAQS
jgi:hypothetical protein